MFSPSARKRSAQRLGTNSVAARIAGHRLLAATLRHALRWAAELRSDTVRLRALLAHCFGVAEQLSAADQEFSAFLATQHRDGSFEPGALAASDARRELVVAAVRCWPARRRLVARLFFVDGRFNSKTSVLPPA